MDSNFHRPAGNGRFPANRQEQLRLLADPRTRHLAMPAPGQDPELERMLARVESTRRHRLSIAALLLGLMGMGAGGRR